MPFECPQNGSGRFPVFDRHFQGFMSITIDQVGLGPGKGLIQMTEIAGIGNPMLKATGYLRRCDLMAPNGIEQSIGRVRHMTVHAFTSGGFP